ncbi:MAG: lipoyl(octanoyl) transferase LipB [Pantoea sp. Brub]|nr:lipoyl(octanoyl) transferase LipB [Pantoea sp. Brub]
MSYKTLVVRNLHLYHWELVYKAMHYYTKHRDANSSDELWLAEHYSIFTQGSTSKQYDNIKTFPKNIPIVKSDRGGKITYHGPGQQLMYILIDLKRKKINIRQLISILEKTVINTLIVFNVKSYARLDAPGIYVDNKKICSLGLRISRGCSFHGLALNVTVDLKPFLNINPCGLIDMKMTKLQHFNSNININDVLILLVSEFSKLMHYNKYIWKPFNITQY